MKANLKILELFLVGVVVTLSAGVSILAVVARFDALCIIYVLAAHWAFYQYIMMVRVYLQVLALRKSNAKLKAELAELERIYPLPVANNRTGDSNGYVD